MQRRSTMLKRHFRCATLNMLQVLCTQEKSKGAENIELSFLKHIPTISKQRLVELINKIYLKSCTPATLLRFQLLIIASFLYHSHFSLVPVTCAFVTGARLTLNRQEPAQSPLL